MEFNKLVLEYDLGEGESAENKDKPANPRIINIPPK